MLKVKDIVFVGTKGVCKIEEIKKNPFQGCDKTKDYYVLKPLSSTTNMVVFLPVDTSVKIRELISKDEAEKALVKLKNREIENSIKDEERFSYYNEIMKNGMFEDRMNILKYLINRKKTIPKKLFNSQEQKMLATVFECVLEELSVVLKKDKKQIEDEIVSSFAPNEAM